jgi:hypothetical protein
MITFLTYDAPIYHKIIDMMRGEKDKANFIFGTKLLATRTPRLNKHQASADLTAPTDHGMAALIDGFAKATNDSAAKSLMGTERERTNKAAEVSRFYSILFASSREIIQEDGSTSTMIVPATIHPLFAPVLIANKNSKATKAIKEAIESTAAELGRHDDKFASAANLYPKMFDQPLIAALRTGQWEFMHTVLNPEGIKTNFGLHHLARPRTTSATYRNRQQGEAMLIQQEQVEEDTSRFDARATEFYYKGRMGTLADVNDEMIGIFCLEKYHHQIQQCESTALVDRNRSD